MAGSEQVGLDGADPDLFEGAVWVLTPTAATDLQAFDRLQGVVMSLGADVLVLSPADHDRLVAVVSHVPHLVAATLMNAASAGAEQDGALLRLAAGGFRDMTRVAAGHPGIWPDICAENAVPIVAGARRAGDRPARHAGPGRRRGTATPSSARSSGPARPGGTCPPASCGPSTSPSCGSRVPDRPGVLAEITSLAADAGIGIYDIEIAHSAEGTGGVLILVVDGADADTLTAAVEAQGYRCPGRAPVVIRTARPRRHRRRALPRHRAHAGREVDLAPGGPAGRPGRGDVDGARAVRRRRRGRHAGGGRGDGRGGRAPRRRDGRAARGAWAAPPGRRPARLWELRDFHAPPGGAGGRARVGDRAGRRRVPVGPSHGPGGRTARPHGGHRARPRASAASRRSTYEAVGCTASTGRPRWPAPR